MKLIIDIPEEVVTAIQNGEDYRYDIHTAIAQGTPVKTVTNAEEAEDYPINQEENCNIVCDFLRNITGIDIRKENKDAKLDRRNNETKREDERY